MRIAFFTETYYPTPDGVSHYLRDIRHALSGKGHDVRVYTLTGSGDQDVNVVSGFQFPFYRQYRIPRNPIPVGLLRRAMKFKPDIIHIHSPFFMGSVGLLASRKLNVPIVASFHTDFSSMEESVRMPFKKFFFNLSFKYSKYLYSQCNEILCPSNHAANIAKSHGMVGAREVPLFVDTDRFVPGSSEKQKMILFVGRLTVDKGVYSILELASAMRGGEYRILICGTGPEEENMLDYIEQHSLQDIVQMEGYVKESRKIELMQVASFFIYPALADTFGISVLEAMACGTPSIVVENFPLHTYANGNSGLIKADFSRIDEVVKLIDDLDRDRENYARRSQSARDFAANTFGIDEHADSLISIYKSLLGTR